MHQAIESAPYSSANPSPIESSPSSQGPAMRSRSVVSSPTEGQATMMPSVAEGFDSFSARQPHSGSRMRTQLPRQPSEPATGTSLSSSPYSDVSRGYSISASHDIQHRQYGSFDSSPSLPPIRGLRSFPDRGPSRSEEQAFPPYSSGYRHSRGSLSEVEASSFQSSPTSTYELPYRPQIYPPLSGMSGLTAADYTRNDQAGHETAHRPGPFGSYPDLEYPPQLLNNQQYANYGMLGDATRRRRGNLPKHITDILKAWFQEHLDHPYPTEEDKRCLQSKTLLSIQQVSIDD